MEPIHQVSGFVPLRILRRPISLKRETTYQSQKGSESAGHSRRYDTANHLLHALKSIGIMVKDDELYDRRKVH